MKRRIKSLTDRLARPLGIRVVNAEWGPRGFEACFSRAKKLGFEPACIIDAGASDGSWTRICLEIFPHARYALFDPLPVNQPELAALASTSQQIAYWSGGLGAAPGRTQINVSGDQSSFFPSSDFPGTPTAVEVRTLDSFIEPMQMRGPALIKADVQGYELEILKGASRTLEFTELLLLEVSFKQIYDGSPLAHEVIADMGRRGYRIYDICSYVQSGADGELANADIVFCRSESRVFGNKSWFA